LWAVLGVIVAVPLDMLHVVTGVLSYAHPTPWMPFGLQAWWVLPLYACAGLALGLGHHNVASRLVTPASTSRVAVALGFASLVASYGSSGLLQSWPVAALVAYVALFVVALVVVDKAARPSLALHGIGTAVVGPAVEALISSTGAFHYAHPDFAGVVLWLPGIYLNAATASHLLDRHLGRR
jgi:hypothetical protein